MSDRFDRFDLPQAARQAEKASKLSKRTAGLEPWSLSLVTNRTSDQTEVLINDSMGLFWLWAQSPEIWDDLQFSHYF